jgi:hypothetical protein
MAATDLYDSELYEVVCGPAVEAFLGAFDSTAVHLINCRPSTNAFSHSILSRIPILFSFPSAVFAFVLRWQLIFKTAAYLTL